MHIYIYILTYDARKHKHKMHIGLSSDPCHGLSIEIIISRHEHILTGTVDL